DIGWAKENDVTKPSLKSATRRPLVMQPELQVAISPDKKISPHASLTSNPTSPDEISRSEWDTPNKR
ncbi:hypothetical protein BaRGS_00002667, partial [Batillaria attramentaria]